MRAALAQYVHDKLPAVNTFLILIFPVIKCGAVYLCNSFVTFLSPHYTSEVCHLAFVHVNVRKLFWISCDIL